MKPTEIKMVAGMLEEEHPDASSLARAIIEALDNKRQSDSMYVLGAMYEGLPLLWGPFATSNQAAKAAGKLVSPYKDRSLPGRVIRVWRIGDTPEA